MKSLRARLLLWVCGSAAGVMIAAAVVLYVLARAYQIEQLDRSVNEKARLIISMITLEGDSVDLEFEELDLRDFETEEAGWYLQVWIDNQSLYRSGSFASQELNLPPAMNPTPGVRWFELPGSLQGRGIFMHLHLDAQQNAIDADATDGVQLPLTVFLARDSCNVLTALRYLAIGLLGVTGGAIGLLGLILTRVVTRSMRPVDELAEAIRLINVADLDSSVQLTALPSELEPIVVQFNGLLTRLQSAFERERGFCADVAHELRTPLAGLRTTLEVTQARPRNHEEYAQAIERCRRVVLQTQDLIDCLLQIGKLETGQVALRPEQIDLNSQLRALWQEITDKKTEQKDYELKWNLAPQIHVYTDPVILQIVIRNLFDNAIEYVNGHGVIEIESVATSVGARLNLTNSGNQVEAADVNKVFDRFWRGSKARCGTGSHFGLGLSLARRAAETLGGTLSVEAESKGVFRASFDLEQRAIGP